MNCSPFDLRDYCLEELGMAEKRQVEAHLATCFDCREEVERLRLTQQTLLRLKDEEVPRRIAFVSDKVFEPSRAARWWAAFNAHVPRLAWSLALLLAVLFGGLSLARPSVTIENGRWQVAFGSDSRSVAAIEARHAADMRDVREAYEVLYKELTVLHQQSSEIRPAAYRQ